MHCDLFICERLKYAHTWRVAAGSRYTLWDRFKVLEDMTIAQASLLARFVAHLIAHFALSLAILKVVEFNTLKGHSLVFFQLLFVTLLTHYDEVRHRFPYCLPSQ